MNSPEEFSVVEERLRVKISDLPPGTLLHLERPTTSFILKLDDHFYMNRAGRVLSGEKYTAFLQDEIECGDAWIQ